MKWIDHNCKTLISNQIPIEQSNHKPKLLDIVEMTNIFSRKFLSIIVLFTLIQLINQDLFYFYSLRSIVSYQMNFSIINHNYFFFNFQVFYPIFVFFVQSFLIIKMFFYLTEDFAGNY